MAYNYTYWNDYVTGVSGVNLHVISAPASNAVPRYLNPAENVTDQGLPGINGSFFDRDNDAILTIAVVDDQAVGGSGYGSGWENYVYSRGTLVYNKGTDTCNVQVVDSASQLNVDDRNDYWAQGGISMSLGDDNGWASQASAENLPGMYQRTTRTGLCYYTHPTNNNTWVLLVVTEDDCTAEEFRQAIKNTFNPTDGIFLDGGGSSQMLAGSSSGIIEVDGDGRVVPEMVRVW